MIIIHPVKKETPPIGVIIAKDLMSVNEYRYSENENNITPIRKNISAFRYFCIPDKATESITTECMS